MPTYREDLHLGRKVPMVETDDIVNGAVTREKINNSVWDALTVGLIRNTGSTAIGPDGYWYVDGVRTDVKAQGEKGADGKDADVWTIGDDGYWYLNGEKTEYKSVGKDGITPQLRVTADGQSLEVSSDGGETWSLFVSDFNKLRVIGYVDSKARLPKNAQIGDIYGVWNAEANNDFTNTKGAYELYINTVKDWVDDYTITKVYSYDTELPSSATDGTAVLVPVSDLTLDKEKVDGYKVYKYSIANNGWVMVLNTAEIYAAKEDIVNHGDNVYALVLGDTENTYKLYKRQVDWVYFGTNASITYKLVQNVQEGTENNVLSGKAVKDAIDRIEANANASVEEVKNDLEAYKEEVKETYGEYVENPEFVKAVTDSEGKLLWGIQKDGNVYFGVGVPRQVKDYINKKVGEILGVDDVTEKIDSLNEVIDFLESYKNSDSLQQLLAEQDAKIDDKVDKEEGKSLVDAEFAEGVSYEENPEFASVLLDKEGRILEAVRKDGTKVLPAGFDVNGVVTSTIDNPEWAAVWLMGDRIAFGIKKDGTADWGAGVPAPIRAYIENKLNGFEDVTEVIDTVKEMTDFLEGYTRGMKLSELLEKKVDGEYVENPEFVQIVTDSDGRVLAGIRTDGAPYFPQNEMYHVVSSPEWLAVWTDSLDKIIFGFRRDGSVYVGNADFLDMIKEIKALLEDIDFFESTDSPEWLNVELDAYGKVLSGTRRNGSHYIHNVESETIPTAFSEIEDVEGRPEMTTDSEQKIISYRDKDGVLHECVGVDTPVVATDNLRLSAQGMTEFQKALKDAGFTPGGGGDFSDKENVEIPEPKGYALVNLIIDKVPTNWNDSFDGQVIYYDFYGNYFKKDCTVSTQGQTSRIFAKNNGKGNYTLDITDGSEIKFGDWVSQDSFHLKGAAKDVTRGILPTSYKFAYKMIEYLDAKPNRVLMNENAITYHNGTGDRTTDWFDDARCLSDGFPVEVYINGEYWGLYAIQLKKHRKNYSMNKKDYESVLLDMDSIMTDNYNDGFWTGDIWWNNIEIKNPKTLICMDGSEYDGDSPKELIDDTSELYDSSNKDHKNTKITKDIIKAMPVKYNEVKALIDTNTSESLAQAKTMFDGYFDVKACMVVYIFNCLMRNYDSIKKNTLWAVYNNGKIAPMLYDLDGIYGESWTGTAGNSGPSADLWDGRYATAAWPLALLWKLYESEIKETYYNLRKAGVISVESWKNIVFGWSNRIGTEAYNRDIEKWSETPSYRKNYLNTEYWSETFYSASEEWEDSKSYKKGDRVFLRMEEGSGYTLAYEATKDSQGVCPVTKFYTRFPVVGGYYNSPKRMEKYFQRQLTLCDEKLGYNVNY